MLLKGKMLLISATGQAAKSTSEILGYCFTNQDDSVIVFNHFMTLLQTTGRCWGQFMVSVLAS